MALKKESFTVAGRRDEFTRPDRASRILRAAGALGASASDVPPTRPPGLFGARAELRCGAARVSLEALDMEFSVPFDDNTEADEAEFTLYNLSPATRAEFALNRAITLTAGYGEDSGLIFSGVVSESRTTHENVDVRTVVHAIDNPKLKEVDAESASFQAGCKASYILKSLLGKLGLPIAVFEPRKDRVCQDPVTVDGGLMRSVAQYAEECGISAYIQRGKIYARDLHVNSDTPLVVDAEHGLIDAPEYFEEEIGVDEEKETRRGYRLKTLLQHRAMTGTAVLLQTRDVKGLYTVKEGQHSCNGTDFVTELTVIE